MLFQVCAVDVETEPECVVLCDVETERECRVLNEMRCCCQVYAVDWSPDGQRVASGGKDKVLKL